MDVAEARRRLEEAGWEPVDGPGHDWVDHVLETGTVRCAVLYLLDPPPSTLDLELELRDGTGVLDTYLALFPGAHGTELIDALVACVPALDLARWPAFFDRLVSVAERVERVAGEDGDDSWVAGPGDHDKVLEP